MGRIREEKGRRKKTREEKESEASRFVVPEARKVGLLAKAAGAEPSGQMRDEKLHAIVARSTFSSQNVQNTSGSDHFCTWTCRKNAHSYGVKHVSK